MEGASKKANGSTFDHSVLFDVSWERDKIASLDGHLDSVIATGKEGTRIVVQHDKINMICDRLTVGERSIIVEKVIRMTGCGGLDPSRCNDTVLSRTR
jgi:hypothetical protein